MLGANYTLSRTWGNVDGENVSQRPDDRDGVPAIPSTSRRRGTIRTGDLSTDQRHRARLWINYGVPKVDGLTVSVLQTLDQRRAVRRHRDRGHAAVRHESWIPDAAAGDWFGGRDLLTSRRATRSTPRASAGPIWPPTTTSAAMRLATRAAVRAAAGAEPVQPVSAVRMRSGTVSPTAAR